MRLFQIAVGLSLAIFVPSYSSAAAVADKWSVEKYDTYQVAHVRTADGVDVPGTLTLQCFLGSDLSFSIKFAGNEFDLEETQYYFFVDNGLMTVFGKLSPIDGTLYLEAVEGELFNNDPNSQNAQFFRKAEILRFEIVETSYLRNIFGKHFVDPPPEFASKKSLTGVQFEFSAAGSSNAIKRVLAGCQ